jgi:hypothetical protein
VLKYPARVWNRPARVLKYPVKVKKEIPVK